MKKAIVLFFIVVIGGVLGWYTIGSLLNTILKFLLGIIIVMIAFWRSDKQTN